MNSETIQDIQSRADKIVEKTEMLITLEDYYSDLTISQYNTDKNKRVLKIFLKELLKTSPIVWDFYFDFENASDQHLTDLAFTLFGIQRSFDNIILTDEELKRVCRFAIIKNNIKILSLSSIVDLIYNVFELDVIADCQDNLITYFINTDLISDNFLKAVVKFKLLPVPIGSKLNTIKLPEENKKYLITTLDQEFFNENIFTVKTYLENNIFEATTPIDNSINI
jgi:hypothetical protein